MAHEEEVWTFVARDVAEVAAVRRHIGVDLRAQGVSSDCVDDLVVMAGELMSNVMRHTTSTARIVLEIDPALLRIAVGDDSRDQPWMQPQDPTRIGGNGIRIVDHLSDSWGTTLHAGNGKDVWFTLHPW